MIGSAPNSTLATTGGSASRGSSGRTWLTLAWTSLKATSWSLSSTNCTITTDTPGAEVERTCSMPGTLLTAPSIRFATLESMISGLAPGNTVCTEITGNSMLGNRSTPMRS